MLENSALQTPSLENILAEKRALTESFLTTYLNDWVSSHPTQARLVDVVRYSLLQKGSKRFRPCLALLAGETCGLHPSEILPFAAAVEMVHTYSLIHDDLPCLDNDDFRRGQPTSHRVFGEALALLGGDVLLTEAFQLISSHYSETPKTALTLISLLSKAAGFRGMVGGQMMDISAQTASFDLEALILLHQMKTGRLIAVATQGAGVLANLPLAEQTALSHFGEQLGLAFQVADDLLDYDVHSPEKQGLPYLVGIERTQKLLEEIHTQALSHLALFGERAESLRQLLYFNSFRKQ